MIIEPLSQDERNELLTLVTEEQRDFLLNRVKRGRRTVFGNIMAEEKVQAIKSVDIELLDNERDILDWDIVDYVDFGEGNRLGKCACNMSLRYMFTVKHKITNKTITYGKHHLRDFLNLPIKDIDNVMIKLKRIDFELDELLIKIKHEAYGYEILDELNEIIEVPKDIQEHLDYQIPLLERQIERIERKVSQFYKEEEEKAKRKQLEAEQKESAKRLESYLKAKELIKERYVLEQEQRYARVQLILEKINPLLPLNPALEQIAYTLVNCGVSSATEISHIIREHFNVDKRISIGTLQRPYIYMDVVLGLMKEAEIGNLYFDQESSNIEDCFFYPGTGNVVEQTTVEELQTTLF